MNRNNRSEQSYEKAHNRSRSGRRSSRKRSGFYTKEVSQMYTKFLLRKSNLPSRSKEPFSPTSHLSKESKYRPTIITENNQDTKSYSTLNVTSQNESIKK